ncbi:hypothetical protein K461DRAFT_14048 [Myriangium duriaei CBS 260.36]|uniref:Uncharacterized protein n=1 Tax=Myriangium duriaei CBS 260.36 TaxID=1168546 RepID=A0A9P4JCS8_9PEZI|nr:hypothetical protein K461DRAFT_14048 [Myriangium duriaei CBS 260.36]
MSTLPAFSLWLSIPALAYNFEFPRRTRNRRCRKTSRIQKWQNSRIEQLSRKGFPKSHKEVDDSLLFWLDIKHAALKAEHVKRRLDQQMGYPSPLHMSMAPDYDRLIKQNWLSLSCAVEVGHIELPHLTMIDVHSLVRLFEPNDLRKWITGWEEDTTNVFEIIEKHFRFTPRDIRLRLVTFDPYKLYFSFCGKRMKQERWDKFQTCTGECEVAWSGIVYGLSQLLKLSLLKT